MDGSPRSAPEKLAPKATKCYESSSSLVQVAISVMALSEVLFCVRFLPRFAGCRVIKDRFAMNCSSKHRSTLACLYKARGTLISPNDVSLFYTQASCAVLLKGPIPGRNRSESKPWHGTTLTLNVPPPTSGCNILVAKPCCSNYLSRGRKIKWYHTREVRVNNSPEMSCCSSTCM